MHTLCKSCGQVTHIPDKAPSDWPWIWLNHHQVHPTHHSRVETAGLLRRWRAEGYRFRRQSTRPGCLQRIWRAEWEYETGSKNSIQLRVPLDRKE